MWCSVCRVIGLVVAVLILSLCCISVVIGVSVIGRVRIYLEDAWEFYRRGREELLRGLERGDVYEVRDGAVKLWNAVVQATNALILHLLGLVPASHWERRKLMELEGRFEEVGKLGLCDRYCAGNVIYVV